MSRQSTGLSRDERSDNPATRHRTDDLDPLVVSPKQACILLGIGLSHLYTLMRDNDTFLEPNRLYYERRDGQYDRLPIERGRIVTTQTSIKTFAAIFLDEPHTSAKSYKTLRSKVGTEIYVKGHRLEPYYVAALAAYKLELQYRSQKIAAEYKPARYHLLLAVRLLMDQKPLPPMNSRDMEKRCSAMIAVLSDQPEADAIFLKAKTIIDKVSKGDLTRDSIRTISTTENIIKLLKHF
jgi:hypothetical protein